MTAAEPQDRPRGVTGLLLVGWCAVACGIAAKDGRYGAWAFALVLAGFFAAAGAVAALPVRAWRGALPDERVGWMAVAVVLAAGPVLRRPRYYAHGPAALASDVLAIVAGLLAAAAILGSVLPGRDGAAPRRTDRGVLLGLAAIAAAGICMIVAAPAPLIDVFHLLQISSRGLVDGADMYRQQWAPSRAAVHTSGVGGLFDVYPYLPGTTVLLAPFRLLFGDVRYGLLAALLAAAFAVRSLAGHRAVPACALLVVAFPESMYALQQSWTEPLLVAALAGTVWAVGAGRTALAVVLFAAALASKQHVALLIPIAAVWPAFGPRRTAGAAGIAAALVAPWVIAGPLDFWHDAVTTNLNDPVLGESLSVPGWLHHFGWTAGFGPAAVVLAGAYLLAWRARGTATGFSAGSALVLLALDVMNKQSFFNHYTLPMGLLAIAVATAHETVTAGSRIVPATHLRTGAGG